MHAFKKAWEEHVQIPDLLFSLGVDLNEEGLEDTPKRVGKAWEDLLCGYTFDPEDILSRTFECEGHGPVICRNIEFCSVCEHHMIPFVGVCSIAYIPDKRVIGLSKLARLVDCFAQRLQIQERMTKQICDAIAGDRENCSEQCIEHLHPAGVLVVTKARHLCCLGRGVKRTKMDFVCMSQQGAIYPALYNLVAGDVTC